MDTGSWLSLALQWDRPTLPQEGLEAEAEVTDLGIVWHSILAELEVPLGVDLLSGICGVCRKSHSSLLSQKSMLWAEGLCSGRGRKPA